MGFVYLLHFDKPVGDLENPRGQAGHYLGATNHLEARLGYHESGAGAALTKAVRKAGIDWSVARTWETEVPWELEKKIKARKRHADFCPVCGGVAHVN